MKTGRISAVLLTMACLAVCCIDEPQPVEPEAYEIPYYMTEEYAEMKRQERIEAEREAQELRESIEQFNEACEREAEERFKQMQNDDGFRYLEIPDEYAREGGSFPEDVQHYVYTVSGQDGVDYAVARAVIEQETGYQSDAVGPDGDTGYFQVIPRFHTERMQRLGVTDMLDPCQNAQVALDYMAELLEKYDGSYEKALTAYNAGQTGAYRYWFSAGVDASPYAKKVLEKAERIREELE